MKYFILIFLLLSSCNESTGVQAEKPLVAQNYYSGTLIASYTFNSPNNSKYGVDVITFDGFKFVVLHDGSKAIQIIREY